MAINAARGPAMAQGKFLGSGKEDAVAPRRYSILAAGQAPKCRRRRRECCGYRQANQASYEESAHQ
jgi:hypothetical protein